MKILYYLIHSVYLKKSICLFIFICASVIASFSQQSSLYDQLLPQEGEEEVPEIIPDVSAEPENRLLLAISNPNYPVTPGDVYRITFLQGGELVANDVLVESDYTINFNIFGKIDASGMTFSELKPIVESLIDSAYPRSLPSLTIVSVGIFQVLILGEVPQTKYVTAWGLSRLSDVVRGNLAPYSSIRRIGVISQNSYKEYDLFQALYQGNMTQDPYISRGDSITVFRAERVVEIKGEVNRPGRYQLLKSDVIKNIERYVQGYTPEADLTRVRIQQRNGDRLTSKTVDFLDRDTEVVFSNGDTVIIPGITQRQSVVFIEGGIDVELAIEPEADEDSTVEVFNRRTYEIFEGDTLYHVLSDLKNNISPMADLRNSQIMRQGEKAPIIVNMEAVLYDFKPEHDIVLQPMDRIILPVRRPTVMVSGDVPITGRFPYNPSENYLYYLNLAGGIDPEQDHQEDITVRSEDGKEKDLNAVIMPGDNIYVHPSDAFVVVSGAVNASGRFPYVTAEDASYYISLAGGVDRERNTDQEYIVYTADGEKREEDASIEAGDTIHVVSNDFVYNFNRYFPIITAGLTFITTLITIISSLSQ